MRSPSTQFVVVNPLYILLRLVSHWLPSHSGAVDYFWNNQLLFDEAAGEDSNDEAESPSATQIGAQGHAQGNAQGGAQSESPSKPRNRHKNRRKRKNGPGGAHSLQQRQQTQQHNLDPTATAVCQQQQQLRQWQLPYGASFRFLIVCACVIFAGVLLQFAEFWVGKAPELSGLSEVP